MSEIAVYCMPGMAASPKIFEYIHLPKPYKLHLLSWILPMKEESLSAYAKRMSERVTAVDSVLIGVSFGGVLVQEMAKHIQVRKVIIVSSIKSRNELPLPMKMARTTNAHKLLPTQWINNLDALALFAFGKGIQKRLKLYQKYLSERNPDYLDWSIDTLVHWDQEEADASVIHIHGKKDTVFPMKYLSKPFIAIEGGHAAIITSAQWFNSELPKLLIEN
ncbi:MAG: alpha/beta hydrolase [Flavobacteriaceae bacterium]|nr:alpha/beta hydrolase [Flavobacteriaceae bacterium]MDG2504110.1 alpha/beta hydrolase [Flavobacteriaceae bacterium]